MKKNVLILTGLVFTLSACSSVNNFLDTKVSVDYQNNKAIKAMEVPPDLTAPQYDRAFDLPEGRTVSVAATQNAGLAPVGYIAPSQASSTPSSIRAGDLSSVRTFNGNAVVQINDTYPRAVILSDIILKRMGFNMVRRDDARGVYLLEYSGEEVVSAKKKNFLNRLFKGSKNKVLAKGKTYQVKVINTGGKPVLRFMGEVGKSLSVEDNAKVVGMINNEFNR